MINNMFILGDANSPTAGRTHSSWSLACKRFGVHSPCIG